MSTSHHFESQFDSGRSAVSAANQPGLDNFRHSIFGPTDASGIDVVKSLSGQNEAVATGIHHPMHANGESSMGNFLEITPISSINSGQTLASNIEGSAANPKFGDAAQPVSFSAAEGEQETLHYSAEYGPGTRRPEYNPEALLGRLNDGTSVWSHLNDPNWVYNNLNVVRSALRNAICHDNRDQFMQQLWQDVANHSNGAIRYTPAYTNFFGNYIGAQLELVQGVWFSRSLLD